MCPAAGGWPSTLSLSRRHPFHTHPPQVRASLAEEARAELYDEVAAEVRSELQLRLREEYWEEATAGLVMRRCARAASFAHSTADHGVRRVERFACIAWRLLSCTRLRAPRRVSVCRRLREAAAEAQRLSAVIATHQAELAAKVREHAEGAMKLEAALAEARGATAGQVEAAAAKVRLIMIDSECDWSRFRSVVIASGC